MSPGCGYTTRGQGHDEHAIMDLGTGDSDHYIHRQSGRHMVGIDIVVIATMFTLIALLTGRG